jgi:nitrite reductase (NADH) large subunit
VRKGDILCTVATHDDVLRVMGRFMQYYREHARYLERTYDFVERVGIRALQRLLVEDAEGLCEGLDAAVQAAVDAFADPWQEGGTPVHPLQFTTVVNSAPAGSLA